MACLTVKRPGICGGIIASLFLLPLSRTGSRRRGKKGREQAEKEYLQWALAGFSGYIAADELYDGPFCILSIVDNRTFKRLVYEVLDHKPTHLDIERFFSRFQAALAARGLVLHGVTTDGSPLYPEPICKVFGTVTHQVCEFHMLADLTHAILHAVAKVRKRLNHALPKLHRGRPAGKRAKQLARRKKRLQQRVAELFEHRYLFVQRELTETERKTLRRITHGLRQLRALREIMQEVYRLFDRRCRMQTALDKLRKLQYASSASGTSARPSKRSSALTWRRRSPFWMTHSFLPRLTRSSAAIAAIARCRSQSTACAHTRPWSAAWRWTCCGTSRALNVSTPWPLCTAPSWNSMDPICVLQSLIIAYLLSSFWCPS
jgi:hypothetical protein